MKTLKQYLEALEGIENLKQKIKYWNGKTIYVSVWESLGDDRAGLAMKRMATKIETPEHAIRLLDLPDEFNTINYEKVNYFSIIKPRTMIDIRVGKHTYNLRFAYPERGFSPRNKDRQWMIKYGGE